MTKSRRRRLSLIAVAAVIAGVLPSFLTLLISYRQASKEANHRLANYATLVERRADQIFGTAEAALDELAMEIGNGCSPAGIDRLRKTVYNSLYFREAGLIRDRAVQCTSVRLYDPPVAIVSPDHLVMPLTGIHIAAPEVTLENEVSIIVVHGIAEANGSGLAVNLLLNPRQLLEPVREAIEESEIALRLERSDGVVLARAGSAAVLADDDTMSFTRSSSLYPIHAVVSGSRKLLMARWWRSVTLFLALGVALSLPLFLLLAQLDRRERSMDAELRDALANDELSVHYQPIHATNDLRVVGAEALLRWQHPVRGMVLPGVFVPMAEETGFIIPITHWLMRSVCKDLSETLNSHPDLYVAVNLSPSHFTDPQLPVLVQDIFGRQLNAGRLVLEVTERELLSSSDQVVNTVIDTLRRDGVRVALDDFGSGYSSLSYLAQFHFDLLKIDKTFIDALGTESVTAGIVEDMVTMAHRLGLKTIAEGVENAEQLTHLRRLGVDFVQGWHLSAALPVGQLKDYLAARRALDQQREASSTAS